MGTRNLVKVIKDNETKVAQYGQWDGYLAGVGVEVLEFVDKLLAEKTRKKFEKNLKKCNWITGAEIDEAYKSIGLHNEWLTIEESEKLSKAFPELSRDCGAEVLNLILKSKNGLKLQDASEFCNDSLFCEYAYVINLDKDSVIVYKNGVSGRASYNIPFAKAKETIAKWKHK